jgi:hypothetical protein
MKPWIAISAAVAALSTMIFSHAATADVVYHPFGMNPAYQVPTTGPLTPFEPRHRYVARYQPYPWTPAACEAVIFPRSPLCAGRPASFGPYSAFPYNMYVYY